MKVAVLGAGAIGAYVGACLDRGGIDVTLIARGAHLAAMQSRGVRVLSPRGDFTAHPRATDDWDAAGEADVVFVGLKANSLTAAAPRLGPVLRPDAAVIWRRTACPGGTSRIWTARGASRRWRAWTPAAGSPPRSGPSTTSAAWSTAAPRSPSRA